MTEARERSALRAELRERQERIEARARTIELQLRVVRILRAVRRRIWVENSASAYREACRGT